jgi:hypothetical protein
MKTRDETYNIAHHEAGHYIAVSEVGFAGCLHCLEPPSWSGASRWLLPADRHACFRLRDLPDEARAARAMIVQRAGVEAHLRAAGADNGTARDYAEHRFASAGHLRRQWPEVDELDVLRQARELVDRNWSRIHLLATALLQHGSLPFTSPETILELADERIPVEQAVISFCLDGLLPLRMVDGERYEIFMPLWLRDHLLRTERERLISALRWRRAEMVAAQKRTLLEQLGWSMTFSNPELARLLLRGRDEQAP